MTPPEDASFDAIDLVPPPGWTTSVAEPSDVPELTALLRRHQEAGRGWASAGEPEVAVELTGPRRSVVLRDDAGRIGAWAGVHDRAAGRMLFNHVVSRDLPDADAVSASLFAWVRDQAVAVGRSRGLAVQQIDTGAFADDARQIAWLADAGYAHVRSWWQMSRPVTPDEADLVPSPEDWSRDGVHVRLVRSSAEGLPDGVDLHAVHVVLEQAFADHFNSREETFAEFVQRLTEDPGHRWDHWWLVTLEDDDLAGIGGAPAGALVGSEIDGDPAGSYVDYIGVLDSARGRGIAKALLNTIVADAAARGRDRVGLEVDADSPTGAQGLYEALGWRTRYITQSWHLDVDV